VLGQRGQVTAGEGFAHQQHVAGVQRFSHHALAVYALAQFTQQQRVDAVGNLEAAARVHGAWKNDFAVWTPGWQATIPNTVDSGHPGRTRNVPCKLLTPQTPCE
jgi:hypothetical protein